MAEALYIALCALLSATVLALAWAAGRLLDLAGW